MKAHNGMRPLDLVVLSKIVALGQTPWHIRDLSATLGISLSEISESLNRSRLAALIDHDKKQVHRLAFMDFLTYGFSYVFPIQAGTVVTGIPTAISYGPFADDFHSEFRYVWPYDKGNVRGLAVEPLHKGVPEAALQDEKLYEILATIEVLRIGRAREKKMALDILKKAILTRGTLAEYSKD